MNNYIPLFYADVIIYRRTYLQVSGKKIPQEHNKLSILFNIASDDNLGPFY